MKDSFKKNQKKPRNWSSVPKSSDSKRTSLMRTLVKWCIQYLTEYLSASDLSFFFEKSSKIERERGIPGLIAFCKAGRTRIIQTLISDPDFSRKRVWRRALYPFFGKVLVRKLLEKPDYKLIRVLLTAASMTRALKLPVSLDVESIVTPSPNAGYWVAWVPSIKRFWKALGFSTKKVKARPRYHWQTYHQTTKAGPNGHALWTCLSDLNSLPERLIQSISVVGGKDLSVRISFLKENLKYLTALGVPTKVGKVRKVSGIQDKEGKTRAIAILDYWSQTALRPLHLFLFRILKRIPQDCTFNQNKFIDLIKDWKDPTFYSIDLTKATDRFPIECIELVLKGYFPSEYVSAWKDIMVGYPFNSKVGEVTYQCGNPMGAYSSWASFALAHHFLVFKCCEDLGIPWSHAPYCLLGDDIVIGNKELGEMYIRRMESLGVQVSRQKSHISKDVCEFAHRILVRGQEVSPFEVSMIIDNTKQYPLLVSSISGELRKNFPFEWDRVPVMIDSLYSALKMPRRFRRDIRKKSEYCLLATGALSGSVAPSVFISKVARDGDLIREGEQVSDGVSDHILRTACLSMFAKSREEKGDSLGDLAIFLTIELSNHEVFTETLHYIPQLFAYGQIEEGYMKMEKTTLEIDTTGGGLWPFLRSLALPISDRILYERNYDVIRRVASGLRPFILEHLQGLKMYYPRDQWVERVPLKP